MSSSQSTAAACGSSSGGHICGDHHREGSETRSCHVRQAQAERCSVWVIRMTDTLRLHSHLFKDGHDVSLREIHITGTCMETEEISYMYYQQKPLSLEPTHPFPGALLTEA
ncbi:hypothetical protein CB1_001857018 [Camelus ferus]|nr:hypothetical protein CB1_001857018 [Camelus ferus]